MEWSRWGVTNFGWWPVHKIQVVADPVKPPQNVPSQNLNEAFEALRKMDKPASNPADKRTPHTDALDTLGSVIGPNEKRDAVHLAVVPAVAAHRLYPGDHVGFYYGTNTAVKVTGNGAPKRIGIVDPFLEGRIEKGDMFWLMIYPRKITSLRHVWTHPDVPEEPAPAPPKSNG